MHISSPRLFRAFGACVAAAVMMLSGDHLRAQVPAFQTSYVTRAEAVMLLLQARVPKIPMLQSNGKFPDVPAGIWYERYIVAAERLSILQAQPGTHRIRPEDPVTRADFISMGAKTFGINTALFSSTYSDVPTQAWYAQAAGMAQRLHLFPTDRDQTRFRPDAYMEHIEVAKAVELLTDATEHSGQWSGSAPSASEKISTTTEQFSLIQPRGPSPTITPGIPAIPNTFDPAQLGKLRLQLLSSVNGERARLGLPLLKTNATLQRSAQLYAREMAQKSFFAHVSPTGETLKQRMENSGYYKAFYASECFCVGHYLMGETLARGQKTSREVVLDWMKSPSHRAAILNPDFSDTGIGIVAGVWVEHFAGRQE